jgi:hypothetical protein
MLEGNNQYHSSIRKVIVAFGTLFSNIQITREDKTGDHQQTIVVPVAYAPKEKWVVRLEQDPDLDGQTYTTLPRISFEITGYSYDPTRKINRMNKINCYKEGADKTSMFSPVPYNIDISLYVLTKTQEDAFQILEQILPLFSPEYTLSIKAVPEMNIIQDIPIVLDSVSVSDEYDGDFQTRRFVTHTLTFTLKTNIYGPVQTQGIITDVTANIGTKSIDEPQLIFNAYVGSSGGQIIENWEEDL